MEHKTLAASAAPKTDLGEFEAIAAAWTADREKDVIHKGAFAQTIRQWRRSGKRLPLHWDHKGDPDKIIGHIDPQSMQERNDGLYVKGQIDQDTPMGRQAWRLIKAGVVGLSFGYLPTQAKNRAGGGRDLHELDVFEISITPAPMHPDTRILSTKSLDAKKARVDEMVGAMFADWGYDEEKAKQHAEEKAAAAHVSDTPHPEPFSSSRTSNWVARRGGLPHFVQDIAHDLLEQGRAKDESEAIEMAIGICKNPPEKWSAASKAKARAAAAEWEKMKAEQANKPGKSVKATWSTAFVNNLPDSSFLYVAPGGKKDSEGKTTPRGLRYFPYKDADGKVDMPHLQNALARIPQSSLSDDVKKKVQAQAERIYKDQKSIDLEMKADGGTTRMLESMIAQGQEFIDADAPGDDDKSVMQAIIKQLTALAKGETAEGGKALSASDAQALELELLGVDHKAKRPQATLASSLVDQRLGTIEGMLKSLEQALAKREEAPALSEREARELELRLLSGDNATQEKAAEREPSRVEEQLTTLTEYVKSLEQRLANREKFADVVERRSADPLRKHANATAEEILTGGIDTSQSPPKEAPKPEPQWSYDELRDKARDDMLIALSGIEDINEQIREAEGGD